MKKSIFAIFLLLTLTGCVNSVDTSKTSSSTADTTLDQSSDTSKQDTKDVGDIDQTITFGNEITTDGNAKINGNTVTITESGNYQISGESSDGQVIINAPDQDVTLTLNNLTLTSSNTSAITGIDANNININLVGENTLSDTENNTDEYQAPVFIDEIETHILGDGTLNLIGNYQEGFESNNDLYIDEGTINIVAQDDGINAGDLLSINGGTINVDSSGDGLDSNGDLEINGGISYISSGNNANGPIDYGEGYSFDITGGVIIAVGGNMGVSPTNDEQTFLTGVASGTTIEVGDYTFDSPKEFSYFFVSYPELTSEEVITVNGNQVEASSEVVNTQGPGGNMGGRPDDMEPNEEFDPSTATPEARS